MKEGVGGLESKEGRKELVYWRWVGRGRGRKGLVERREEGRRGLVGWREEGRTGLEWWREEGRK